MKCRGCAALRRELAALEADFLARSRDYHDTLGKLAAERNLLWAQLQRRGPRQASAPIAARSAR